MGDEKRRGLFLFDVHGTLAVNKCQAPDGIRRMLGRIRESGHSLALVSGSSLREQVSQLGPDLIELFDYVFTENGAQFHKNGKLVRSRRLLDEISEEEYSRLINRILVILGETDCPVKRGTFVEMRESGVNVSVIGRSCSTAERVEFDAFDRKNGIRRRLVEQIRPLLDELGLDCAIGGQISVDIFPVGWDKTQCLNMIEEGLIYFIGDKTEEGGNDHGLFSDSRTVGFTTTGPEETIEIVDRIIGSDQGSQDSQDSQGN
ncbi:PMM [Enterospora canceri]|uniref:Phosphomannomutase n=1 Tax=Enterospora canceri TaxID=1081671 RepID=A0A1Y1S953_9MICR|nr:PMM [Enterospora canceri]